MLQLLGTEICPWTPLGDPLYSTFKACRRPCPHPTSKSIQRHTTYPMSKKYTQPDAHRRRLLEMTVGAKFLLPDAKMQKGLILLFQKTDITKFL